MEKDRRMILLVTLFLLAKAQPTKVYTDLSIKPLPGLKWTSYYVNISHFSWSPNQPRKDWFNSSINFWNENILQITSDKPGYDKEVIYYSVDYPRSLFSFSIEYWCNPFTLLVGKGYNREINFSKDSLKE